MKRVFSFIYIVIYVVVMAIILMLFLLSLRYTIFNFPPTPIWAIISFFTISSFYASIKIHKGKGEMRHLLMSIIVPSAVFTAPLYYVLPYAREMEKIFEWYSHVYGEDSITFKMLSVMTEHMMGAHRFHSLYHFDAFFSYDSVPLVAAVLLLLSAYSFGQYKRYANDSFKI